LELTDGEIPIGSTGADPVAATITGDGTFDGAFGVAIENGAGSITLGLNASVQAWITEVSTILSISPPG
jgi:hypothetical protein